MILIDLTRFFTFLNAWYALRRCWWLIGSSSWIVFNEYCDVSDNFHEIIDHCTNLKRLAIIACKGEYNQSKNSEVCKYCQLVQRKRWQNYERECKDLAKRLALYKVNIT